MISSYEVRDGKVLVKTPYCDAVADTCRRWGGKFVDGAWVLPPTRLPAVQEQLGVDPADAVEVEVGAEDWSGYGQLHVGWYVLAGRRSRDRLADLYADLVAGEVPPSGGSVKNPGVAPSPDARFRLTVPRDFAAARGLQVIEPAAPPQAARWALDADVAALRAERERLRARLAEVDAQLAAVEAATA